jgi:ankyrin repeat protein
MSISKRLRYDYFLYDPSNEYNANLFEQDSKGNTLLMYAVYTDNKDATKTLLSYGLDPNIPNNNGKTALMYASNSKIIKLLLDHGADVNAQDHEGSTPLMDIYKQYIFLHNQNIYTNIKLLIYHGADIYIQDNDGHIILDYTSDKDRKFIMETYNEYIDNILHQMTLPNDMTTHIKKYITK